MCASTDWLGSHTRTQLQAAGAHIAAASVAVRVVNSTCLIAIGSSIRLLGRIRVKPLPSGTRFLTHTVSDRAGWRVYLFPNNQICRGESTCPNSGVFSYSSISLHRIIGPPHPTFGDIPNVVRNVCNDVDDGRRRVLAASHASRRQRGPPHTYRCIERHARACELQVHYE